MLAMAPLERIDAAVALAVARYGDAHDEDLIGAPLHGGGMVNEAQARALEDGLGQPLPAEYAYFVRRHGWLFIDDGLQIAGAMPPDQVVGEGVPWISREHRPPEAHLVVGAFWMFGDGDQLLLDLADGRLIAYLHEQGPLLEELATSFSLGLYRLITELAP